MFAQGLVQQQKYNKNKMFILYLLKCLSNGMFAYRFGFIIKLNKFKSAYVEWSDPIAVFTVDIRALLQEPEDDVLLPQSSGLVKRRAPLRVPGIQRTAEVVLYDHRHTLRPLLKSSSRIKKKKRVVIFNRWG